MIEKEFNEAIEQASNDISLGASDGNQYFTFLVADHEYGVDILRVQEIRGWNGVRQVPQLPSYIKGVIDLRGDVIPIIDLRERFGILPVPYNHLTVVVVIKVITQKGEQIMGIVVDAVSDVYEIAPDDLKKAPEMNSGVDVNYIQHIATVDDKMVVLLDIDELLGNLPREIAKQQGAGAAKLGADIDDRDVTEADLDVESLESTCAALMPYGEALAESFYRKLFKRYPEVEPLFDGVEIKEQEQKLLATLKLVVENIRRPEKLTSELNQLGERHQSYGVLAAHYDAAAEVLLETIGEYAGGLWTDKVRRTWVAALMKIKAAMVGAYETALPKDQVVLLESSFAILAPQADVLAERFYQRLFELHPDVQPMFEGSDLAEQQKKLVAALQLVINSLRNPDILKRALGELGKKHQAYGAVAAHYDAVAAVMLEVLEEFAGDQWNSSMVIAWGDALDGVKAMMLDGYVD